MCMNEKDYFYMNQVTIYRLDVLIIYRRVECNCQEINWSIV